MYSYDVHVARMCGSIPVDIYYTILLRATIFTATLSSGQLNLFAERWYWPIGRCVGLCRFYLQNEIKARWGSVELERRRIMWQMW